MKIIKIKRYKVSKRVLAQAVAVLNSGGIVVFPTETAYGLAADPSNPKALEKIYKIKGRIKDKRLPLVAGDKKQVKAFFKLNKNLFKLTSKHWPGPLTVVALVRSGTGFSDWKDVAIRVPASVWARAIPNAFGKPVTSTSANRSGKPNCYSASAVRGAFSNQKFRPDLILDAGQLPKRPPSTIIKSEKGRLVVLRPGSIKVE